MASSVYIDLSYKITCSNHVTFLLFKDCYFLFPNALKQNYLKSLNVSNDK